METNNYGYGRSYYIHIIAEDVHGNIITFDEVVRYPDRSRGLSGCVKESEREAKGITQVKERMPYLRNVRAEGSIHT